MDGMYRERPIYYSSRIRQACNSLPSYKLCYQVEHTSENPHIDCPCLRKITKFSQKARRQSKFPITLSLSSRQEKFYLPDWGIKKEDKEDCTHLTLKEENGQHLTSTFNSNNLSPTCSPFLWSCLLHSFINTRQLLLSQHKILNSFIHQGKKKGTTASFFFLLCVQQQDARTSHGTLISQLLVNFSNVTLTPQPSLKGVFKDWAGIKLLNSSSSARPFCTYHGNTSMQGISPLKSLPRCLQRITFQLIH